MNLEIIPANSSHVEDYFILFSSEKICKYMDIDCFKNINDAKIFLDFSESQNKSNKSKRFSIKSKNEVIGIVCIYSIYWHQHRASIGYALKEKYWNQGIMKNVLKEIEVIVKNEMNINRLQATVLQENLASKNLLKRCGFEYEGLLKQYEIWGSKGFVDLEMYSIILGRNA
ncbi:MAG TPA: GNAT family N-acetyltransferase [Treponema sp.]|nr:GNAT family N-acetyltransferase [Treponema sp.]